MCLLSQQHLRYHPIFRCRLHIYSKLGPRGATWLLPSRLADRVAGNLGLMRRASDLRLAYRLVGLGCVT